MEETLEEVGGFSLVAELSWLLAVEELSVAVLEAARLEELSAASEELLAEDLAEDLDDDALTIEEAAEEEGTASLPGVEDLPPPPPPHALNIKVSDRAERALNENREKLSMIVLLGLWLNLDLPKAE